MLSGPNDDPREVEDPASLVLRIDLEFTLRRFGSLGRKTRRRDLNRSVHDGPSLHINSVGKRLVAFCAPGIRMTGQNLCLALWAIADAGDSVCGLNKSFLVHVEAS